MVHTSIIKVYELADKKENREEGRMNQSGKNSLHPGGIELTKSTIAHCLPLCGTWLDIGCGYGETVRLLCELDGVNAIGLDCDARKIEYARSGKGRYLYGDAHELSFGNACADGIIMECCLSLMRDAGRVISECARILKTGGTLILSDVYARGQPAPANGTMGNLYGKEDIYALLSGRFSVKRFEDHSDALETMMGQMLMDRGADAVYGELGNRQTIRLSKPGYYCLIAKRNEP